MSTDTETKTLEEKRKRQERAFSLFVMATIIGALVAVDINWAAASLAFLYLGSLLLGY